MIEFTLDKVRELHENYLTKKSEKQIEEIENLILDHIKDYSGSCIRINHIELMSRTINHFEAKGFYVNTDYDCVYISWNDRIKDNRDNILFMLNEIKRVVEDDYFLGKLDEIHGKLRFVYDKINLKEE